MIEKPLFFTFFLTTFLLITWCWWHAIYCYHNILAIKYLFVCWCEITGYFFFSVICLVLFILLVFLAYEIKEVLRCQYYIALVVHQVSDSFITHIWIEKKWWGKYERKQKWKRSSNFFQKNWFYLFYSYNN